MVYDVIVAGLGPGGAIAAYELAKSGMKVLALEKAKLPRYKACGGCVATKVDQVLDFSLEPVTERKVYGAVFTYRGKSAVEIVSDRPLGYMTMRDRLDNLLTEKAKEAGTAIRDGEAVDRIITDGRGVEVFTERGKFQGRVLIGADGVNSVAARALGVDGEMKKAVALEVEAKVPAEKADAIGRVARIDFGVVPGGYGWVFPKADTLSFGIGGLRSNGGNFRHYLDDYIKKDRSLAGVEIDRVYGHQIPAFEGGLSRLSGDSVLLVGDAGGLVDPFLGEGIYYAVRSGQIAAETVKAHLNNGEALSSYDEKIRGEIYPELEAALKVSRFAYAHPWLWHQIMRANKGLLQSFFDVIRGEDRYDNFVNRMRDKVALLPRKIGF
ncbi:MAG: geranylgeranyl reductase family protein [Nitrospirota bacterium]|nr:geranylgeranyl reductase family protein [Nitrospirota bacterium]